MPTKVGAVLMVLRPGWDPGCSRPCYAAWWPGDCSGWGRERIEVAARAFLRPRRASGATAYHPHPHVMAARQAAVGNIQGGRIKAAGRPQVDATAGAARPCVGAFAGRLRHEGPPGL